MDLTTSTTPTKATVPTPETLAAMTDLTMLDWLLNGLPATADGKVRKPLNAAAMLCIVMRLRQHRSGTGAKTPQAHKLADAARARGIGAGRSGFDPDVARSRLEGGA
jgi:hypothetical protein